MLLFFMRSSPSEWKVGDVEGNYDERFLHQSLILFWVKLCRFTLFKLPSSIWKRKKNYIQQFQLSKQFYAFVFIQQLNINYQRRTFRKQQVVLIGFGEQAKYRNNKNFSTPYMANLKLYSNDVWCYWMFWCIDGRLNLPDTGSHIIPNWKKSLQSFWTVWE